MTTQIIVTFKDEFTGEIVEREIGTTSEFFMWSEDYRERKCQEWADTRGNEQHASFLTFISWKKA